MEVARATHELINLFDYSFLLTGKIKLPLQSPILTAILLGNSYRMSEYKASKDDLDRLHQYQENYSLYPGLSQYVQTRLLNSAKLYKRTSKITLIDKTNPFHEAQKELKIIAHVKLSDFKSAAQLMATLQNKSSVTYHIYQQYIKNRQYKLLLIHKSILGNTVTWQEVFKYSSEMDVQRIIRSDYVTDTQIFQFAYALIRRHYIKRKYIKLSRVLEKLKLNKRFIAKYRTQVEAKHKDVQHFPDIYQIETDIKNLASNPDNARALFNIGYFNQQNSLYINKLFGEYSNHAPFDHYTKALSLLDKNKQYDFEDKLLYYLIRCFKDTKEKIKDCAAQYSYSTHIRKKCYHWRKWATALLRKYPNSKWVKRLPKYMIVYAENKIREVNEK